MSDFRLDVDKMELTQAKARIHQLESALKEAKMALETIDKEVRGLAKGLLKSKPVICPDSDTLHWEGVSPKDLEPCEYDVALSKGWMKLLKNTSEKALATINQALEKP